MPFSVTDVDAVFAAAIELSSPDERAEYVQRVCGENVELRQRVDELLMAHFEAGDFLQRPHATVLYRDDDIQEGPSTVIGPYKLLQQIGEGGMGVVFMAEQTEPIQRTVAVKIIKPGMDTRQVIARFEAERQALAMMDHPNIAKVLDAGTTAPASGYPGRPYFVMELVKGVPITKYCDEKQLSLRQRLELITPVCEAVQHAHQKGIIHRDLKPTNVLVAEYDNRAVPKVIDFGVAKATAQKLTERTMFTEFGQVIGTVEYMSPEQAKFNQLDIDTRSDIYSLGVLLYELLTGSTPFERERLREAAFDEVLRIIREEEPPRPSTRLSTSETLPSIAANRHTEPARLSKDVSGELDWIVMKCLEKDRNRRYETANCLVRDIERYLHDEPVQACPPSAAYRFRKFARRHRGPLVAAGLVVAALIGGIVVSTWQAVRAIHAEQLALAERDAKESARREAVAHARQAQAVSDFLVNVLRSPSPKRDGRTITIAEVLQRAVTDLNDKFADDPLTNGALMHAIGESLRGLGLHAESIPILQKARELRIRALGVQHPDSIRCVRDLSWGLMLAKRAEEALPLLEENRRISSATLGRKNPVPLQCAYDLAACYSYLDRHDESLAIIEETFSHQVAILGRDHPDTVESMYQLAINYSHGGRRDEAAKLYREVIQATARHPHSLFKFAAMESLAILYADLSRFEEAVTLINETVKLNEEWLGQEHLGSRNARADRGLIYFKRGKLLSNASDLRQRDPSQALQVAKEAIDLDPERQRALLGLGWAEYRAEHWKKSVDALTKSCDLDADGGGAYQWFFLAMAQWQLDRKDEAHKWFVKAVEWMEKNQSKNEELLRFRDEATELLGISEPNSTKSAPPAEEAATAEDSTTTSSPTTDY
jgi:eukaryotic-like serine/threonine-protein kinase